MTQIRSYAQRIINELRLPPEREAKALAFVQKLRNGKDSDKSLINRNIKNYEGRLQGLWGEIEIASRLSNVEEQGVPLRQAVLTRFGSLPGRDKLNGEVDVIFRTDAGALAFGEVKTYQDIMTPRNNHWVDILSQARAFSKNKQLKLIPESVEHHIYFPSGITEEAARELEALGATVHGQTIIGGLRP